jgi:transcriptional regulator with XRE-family HTH domain
MKTLKEKIEESIKTCESCGGNMQVARATSEKPYRYLISGVKDLFLVGIFVASCPACKQESPIIPRMAELHRVIATSLLQKKEFLRGDEIKFLRKNAGFAAQDFAALLGITPSHLSRIENGKTKQLGSPADRLARLVAKAQINGDVTFEALKELASEKVLQVKEHATSQRELFKLEKNRWHREKEAA